MCNFAHYINAGFLINHHKFNTLYICITCLLLLSPCIAAVVTAQQIIINGKGEKIVIYPDGSWRHYEDADSVLVRKKTKLDDVITQKETEQDLPVLTMNSPLDDEESLRQAIAFTEQLRREEIRVRQELRTATSDKFDTEAQLEEAYDNKDILEPDVIVNLEEKADGQTESMKFARKRLKKLSKIQEKAVRLTSMAPDKRYQKMQKLLSKYQAYEAYKTEYLLGSREVRLEDRQKQVSKKEEKGISAGSDKAKIKSRLPGATGMGRADHTDALNERINRWAGQPPVDYRRAPSSCDFNVLQSGQRSGNRKVELKPSLLFTHTDDELRPYFGEEELVTCIAYLTELGDYLYLTLEFRIASPNAQKNFGPLAEGSLLRVKLLDGIFVNLYNARHDIGRIDPYSGHTLYTGRYAIGNSERKSLEKAPLEFLRVVWGTGFEDYPVFNLDFFIQQLGCLESAE